MPLLHNKIGKTNVLFNLICATIITSWMTSSPELFLQMVSYFLCNKKKIVCAVRNHVSPSKSLKYLLIWERYRWCGVLPPYRRGTGVDNKHPPKILLPTVPLYGPSRSVEICRFSLFLLFWNQILTWVSVSCKELARHARSALLR